MTRHSVLFIVLFLGVWIGVFGSNWLKDEYKLAQSDLTACQTAIKTNRKKGVLE